MDLPPPFHHRHHHRHHHHDPRYGNGFQPPDFFSPSLSHHLSPPPLPPTILPPPPPPPPPSHIGHPFPPPRITFSPPHQHILERSRLYDCGPPMLYPDRNILSPPPPRENLSLRPGYDSPERNPIFRDEIFQRRYSDSYFLGLPEHRVPERNPPVPQENLSLRLHDYPERNPPFQQESVFMRLGQDYPERNPILRDETFHRGFSNNFVHGLSGKWDRNVHWDRRELNSVVSDVGSHERYNNIYQGHELHDKGDGSVRKRDSGINLGGRLYNERDDERRWDYRLQHRSGEWYNERDDDRGRLGYGINDRILSRVEKRQRVSLERDSSLSRFSERLGRRVSDEDFVRDKEIGKLQKKSALDGIQQEKVCGWRNGGSKFENVELHKHSFGGEKKEKTECFEAKEVDKKEREQSPVELAITFKSNTVVAKPILAPCSPNVRSNMELSPRNSNIRKMNGSPASPSVASSTDIIKTDPLTRGLCLQSDSHETEKELLDKPALSANGSMTSNDAGDHDENVAEDEPPENTNYQDFNDIRSGLRRVRRLRKKKRARKRLDSFPEGNVHPPSTAETPDAFTLPSLNSEKGIIDIVSTKPVLPYSKRKRDSVTTSLASVSGAHDVIPEFGGATERLINTPEDDGHVNLLGTGETEGHADETLLASDKIVLGDSLGFVQHADNVDVIGHNLASVLNLEKCLTESNPDCVDDIIEHPFQAGILSVENACVENSSADMVSSESRDTASYSRPQDTSSMEIQEDNYVQDIHESCSTSESECLSNQKSFKIMASVEDHDISGEREDTEEDGRLIEVPYGAVNPSLAIEFGADDSFPRCTKKRKAVSPRLTLYSLQDDCSYLGQESEKLPELEADRRESTPATAPSMIKCSTADSKIEVVQEELTVADTDKTLADGYELHRKDGPASTPEHLYLPEDGKGICAADSGDELIVSGFDALSCPSSPEDLLSHTDFSVSSNSKASPSQSNNATICSLDATLKGKLMPAKPNTFLLQKSSQKANSGNLQTNAQMRPSLRRDNGKLVQRPNLVYRKSDMSKTQLPIAAPKVKTQLPFAAPKVFPHRPALNFNSAIKFPSPPVTKSRTWHRTGNSAAVTGSNLQAPSLPQSHGPKTTKNTSSSYIRKGNSLVRKPSPSGVTPTGPHLPSSSVYRLSPSIDNFKKSLASGSDKEAINSPDPQRLKPVSNSERPESVPLNCYHESGNSATCRLEEPLTVANSPINIPKRVDALDEPSKPLAIPECRTGSGNMSDSQTVLNEGNAKKRIKYVKRRSNQLVAAPETEDTCKSSVDKAHAPMSDRYFKRRKNQLVRASSESPDRKGDSVVDLNSGSIGFQAIPPSSGKQQPGFFKSYRSSKLSLVWQLHDAQSSEKHKNPVGPQKAWPHLFPWKRATYRRNFMLALGSKPSHSFSLISQKVLLSRKRGVVYTRSTHGYSLRISKVVSVSGSSLKWSKSIERNSKKATEEAMRAVAAAETRKKEEKIVVPLLSKSRSNVSRKSVLSVKLRPGERIFRIGSERYKMDPTRRTLYRITAEEEPSPARSLQTQKNIKRSFVPRRLLIGNDEYVRIGNGNKLVRDPKKRIRLLASEKVRWSLRTARLRMAKKKKYCQFFTRFGKCNKDAGKCPYIHDPSKIAVCTKFLNGSCSNLDCKLTHKVIPERMQDCSYFMKGLCSNENCPYRHVNVDPDSPVCESFIRGYCPDGNECRKKHTYVCPAFEATGICPQASTCKLHHPKKKNEQKPASEQKIVRGRYFDGGLIGFAECSTAASEKCSEKGKDEIEGKFPDYISLDVSDGEADQATGPKQVCDDVFSGGGGYLDYISLDVGNEEGEHTMAVMQVGRYVA